MTDGIKESPESTHLCPVYYAGSGKGYSGQPEKGDLQYLYFPTGQDKDRYVIGSVDAGAEKMEQLERREKDESAGEAPKAQAAEAELPDTKSWSTPGNRRMVLNKGGVVFADGAKGRVNTGRCGREHDGKDIQRHEEGGEHPGACPCQCGHGKGCVSGKQHTFHGGLPDIRGRQQHRGEI